MKKLLLPVLFLAGCKKDNEAKGTTVPQKTGMYGAKSLGVIPVLSDSQLAIDCFDNTFMDSLGTYGSSYKISYWGDQLHSTQASFWITSEETETQIDAYNVNPTQKNKSRVQYLLFNIFPNQHAKQEHDFSSSAFPIAPSMTFSSWTKRLPQEHWHPCWTCKWP